MQTGTVKIKDGLEETGNSMSPTYKELLGEGIASTVAKLREFKKINSIRQEPIVAGLRGQLSF